MTVPRMLTIIFVLVALVAFVPRADAAESHATRMETVIVRLADAPLAQPAFARPEVLAAAGSSSARGRRKLDLALPEVRTYLAKLGMYQTRVMKGVLGAGLHATLGRRFEVAFDGFSATLPLSAVGTLARMRGIAGVYPAQTYRPLLDTSVKLINAPAAWQALGGAASAGRGSLIADLDTGIDLSNPCFSGAGFSPPRFGRRSDTSANRKYTNNKVVIARAFGSDPTLNYSAADTSGHGTFTAGIEACDANTPTPLGTQISGVAPGAWLGNYNVFPTDSGTTSDPQLLAALDAAALDGADVINMSLGYSSGDTTVDPWTYAIRSLNQSGIPVVVSAGNDGPNGQSVGSPASAPDAIAVGSVTNAHNVFYPLNVTGPGSVPADLQNIPASQAAQPVTLSHTVGPAGYVYVGLARKPGDDSKAPKANDLKGVDLQGKIALIKRGDIYFTTKVNNVAARGAIGAIIFDNLDELLPAISAANTTIPTLIVTRAYGEALLTWLNQHPDAQVTISGQLQVFPETPDILSNFSSRGPTAPFAIKPDVVAPGENIYAPTEQTDAAGELYNQSGFAVASGTSFSGPHVAGVVALMLQSHPKWTPRQVKDVLMNTASNQVYANATKTSLAPIMEQGAGIVNAAAALNPPGLIDPPSLTYGATNVAYGTRHLAHTLTVSDLSSASESWSVTTNVSQGAGMTVSTPPSVTVAAGGTASVPVTVTLSATRRGPIDDEGYIDLTSGAATLHVPFWVRVIDHAVPTSATKTNRKLLLVDASSGPVKHADPLQYYESALQALHRGYSYWSEAQFGSPTLSDLQRAAGVIYFTGANVGDLQAQSPVSPVSATDQLLLHQYLHAGGRLFISGVGVALASPYWTAVVLGGYADSTSLFDVDQNDPKGKGGIAPPKPSAVATASIFKGLKALDISNKGNGAHDNAGQVSSALGIIGVSELRSASGSFAPAGNAYGHVVLRAPSSCGAQCAGGGMAVINNDEPSLTRAAKYHGRSIYFSFGFEGINDNTGYATRTQVLRRVLRWLDDAPSVAVYRKGGTLRAHLISNVGAYGVRFVWRIGRSSLHPSAKSTIKIAHRATRVRVQVTDSLGHVAVSRWVNVGRGG